MPAHAWTPPPPPPTDQPVGYPAGAAPSRSRRWAARATTVVLATAAALGTGVLGVEVGTAHTGTSAASSTGKTPVEATSGSS